MSSPNDFDISRHFLHLTRQLLARDELSGVTFSHGDIVGGHSETIIRDFMRDALAPHFRVETGQVVARNGVRTPQSDVIAFYDVPGSILGRTEDGRFLIRSEAVRCVIEVKRSIHLDTIQEIQDYSRRLRESFGRAKRQEGWLQWSFAFRSIKSRDEILTELRDTHDGHNSTGALIVLDAKHSNEQIQSLTSSLKSAKPTKKHPAQQFTFKSLRTLVEAAKVPCSCMFQRDHNEKYIQVDDGVPSLLSYMRLLERFIVQQGSPSPMSLSDFS